MPNSTPDFDSIEQELHTLLAEPSPTCPSLPLLLAASQQALPPEANAIIQQHLQHCRLCERLLQDFSSLPEVPLSPTQQQSIASRLPSTAPGTTAMPSRRMLPALGAIAALLLVAVSAYHFVGHRQASEVAQIRRAAPAPTPTTVAQIEIPLLPLAPPADDATTLLPRGGHTGINPTTDELTPAFTAYNRGDYKLATQRFSALAKDYPRSDLVSLYQGVSQLFLHQDESALSTLQVARRSKSKSLADSAQWYSVIAANQTHSDSLRPLLEALCNNSDSNYYTQSCSILSKLK